MYECLYNLDKWCNSATCKETLCCRNENVIEQEKAFKELGGAY